MIQQWNVLLVRVPCVGRWSWPLCFRSSESKYNLKATSNWHTKSDMESDLWKLNVLSWHRLRLWGELSYCRWIRQQSSSESSASVYSNCSLITVNTWRLQEVKMILFILFTIVCVVPAVAAGTITGGKGDNDYLRQRFVIRLTDSFFDRMQI